MQPEKTAISKKVILIPLIMISVFILIIFGVTDLYFNKTLSQQYEKDMIRLAHSGAQLIDFLDQTAGLKDFDRFADTFVRDTRFRVTIIDVTGKVLGDSRLSLEEVRQLENYSDHPEMLEAKDEGVGISRRHSGTLDIDLLYVAARYNNMGHQGYMRIAMPLDELYREQSRQRLLLAGFCFLTLCIAAGNSLLFSRYLLQLVKRGEAYLEAQVKTRTREIEILQNSATQLTACRSMQEMLEVVKLIATMLLPRFTGSLAVTRASRDKIEVLQSWNGEWKGAAYYAPDECWALRTGKAHMGDVATGNVLCEHSPDPAEKTFCIPLVALGETHGVLHFSGPQTEEWSMEERQLAMSIAEHISLTLANLQLRDSLRQQAIHDPLTGLFNRRYLLETLEREISRATRNHLNMGVIMIDLDHFKHFNDEHGHDTGDYVLSEFGRLTRMILREEDIPCRFGGEEFVILLPETDSESTYHVAMKLVEKTREHDFVFGGRSYGPVTLSVGAATFPQHGQNPDQLLKIADDALYEAKNAGRNRAVLADVHIID
jgi:diguanylate cyclase (GGDEF)-like protein